MPEDVKEDATKDDTKGASDKAEGKEDVTPEGGDADTRAKPKVRKRQMMFRQLK